MSEPFWTPLGGQPVDWEGAWAAGTQYAPGDVVTYNGVNYLAVNPSLGVNPGAAAALPQAVELIAEVDLNTIGGFSSIPQTYDTLRLVYKFRLSTAVVGDPLYLRCNDDASAVYDSSRIYIDNNVLNKDVLVSQTEARIATAPGASAVAGEFVHGEVVIPSYSLVGDVKTWFGSYMGLHTRAVTGIFQGTIGGCWYASAAIAKLSLIGQGGGLAAAGSRAWLYGMRGA